jgi:hypothetical protein
MSPNKFSTNGPPVLETRTVVFVFKEFFNTGQYPKSEFKT